MSRIEGLGKLAGQIVCEEGRPIYQGLVKEGIVKLTAWAFLIGTDVFWVLSSHDSREIWHYEENHFTINASWIRTLFAMCAAMQWSMASDGLLLVQCPIAPEMVSPCPCSLNSVQAWIWIIHRLESDLCLYFGLQTHTWKQLFPSDKFSYTICTNSNQMLIVHKS